VCSEKSVSCKLTTSSENYFTNSDAYTLKDVGQREAVIDIRTLRCLALT
jgi:hypothetical protein